MIHGTVYVADTNTPAKITVVLLDASSGDALTIVNNPPVQTTTSDPDGQYAFQNVKPGAYIVAVQGKGAEVSFCGTNYGQAEFAIGPTPTWVISYMKLADMLKLSAGGSLQQDIVIKCN